MDFKAAREAHDLTLKQVSELAGYSIPTINALELEGRGSDRLREKLLHIYQLKEASRMELRETPPEGDLEIWRRRAKLAEKQLAELRSGLRGLLEKGTNSKPLSEAQQIVAASAERTGTKRS